MFLKSRTRLLSKTVGTNESSHLSMQTQLAPVKKSHLVDSNVLFLSPTMHQEQNDGTDRSVQLPRAESPSCFRQTHRNTPWAQRGMIAQHQAWPSRIAYATRPLGVRCRPRESTPTQCPKAYGVELHTTWWNAASMTSRRAPKIEEGHGGDYRGE